jgi:hypothetical protein
MSEVSAPKVTFTQLVVVLWTILITILASSSNRNLNTRSVVETRTFCAYGRVFVEFEENGKQWGTLMLDFRGNPIPCEDHVEPKLTNTI